MKRILLLLLLLASAGLLRAQDYRHAIGLRGGLSSGFEYRYFFDDVNSMKFLLSSRDRGLQLHGLYEFHQRGLFSFSEQMTFFYGAGLHAGYERYDVRVAHNNTFWLETRTKPIVGLDGLAGLEYTFYEFPLSVGLEVKPFFDVGGRRNFDVQPFDFAFTIKYLF